MASREELSCKKASELQQMLEERGLDSSGRKAELVEKLMKAMPVSDASVGNAGETKVSPTLASRSGTADDAQALLAQMRILKEREALAEQEIASKARMEQEQVGLKARMEQEQVRIRARREQLDLEERLVDMGRPLTDADVRSATVQAPEYLSESAHVTRALSMHIQRSLLPQTDLTPFSGNVQDYRLFTRAFDTRVANKTDDQNELLAYLDQFTRGRPNRVVRNFLHLGEQGYRQARLALEREYGNSHILIDSYVGKLRSWPRINSGDVQGLDQLVLFLVEVQNAMLNVSMGELEHPRTLREVVHKLPSYLRDRWLREADKLMEAERKGTDVGFVGFKDLVRFLEKEVRILKNPVFGVGISASGDLGGSASKSTDVRESRAGSHRVNALNVGGGSPGRGGRTAQGGNRSAPASGAANGRQGTGGFEPRTETCMFCGKPHSTDVCDQLRWKPLTERKAFLFQKQLCFGCLKPGHLARSCQVRLTCGICGRRHATLLHRSSDRQNPSSAEVSPAAQNVVSAGVGVSDAKGGYTMMPVVPVRLIDKAGKEVCTNAFLDQGSSGCFITSRLASQLTLEKDEVTITIDTVASEGQEVTSAVVDGARVGSTSSDETFPLPPLFTLDHLPVSRQDKCRSEDLERWPHLVGVPLGDLDAPVELMIGSNAAQLLVAQEVRPPEEGDGPYGVKTCLGWYVFGSGAVGSGADPRCTVSFLRVSETTNRPDDSVGEALGKGWSDEPPIGDKPEAEVKASPVCPVGVTVSQNPSEALVTHYSSFFRLKRAVAWYHRLAEVIRSGDFRTVCLARRKGLRLRKPCWRTELEPSDLEKAEGAILRHVQSDMPEFPSGQLDGPVEVKRNSQLVSLRPLMRDGLLVVGGRLCLEASPSMSTRAKHPVIVPQKHHVARLLMREAHLAVGHQGRDRTLWMLRERYWVMGAGADVRKMLRSCLTCRKANVRPQEQHVADLRRAE